jgi:DNA-binding YbaB/EbfC family protein
MFNMFDMMGKVKDFQAKVKQAKQDLVHITYTAESGMVKVTVNGIKQVLAIEVADELFTSSDKQNIVKLITSTTNMAMAEVDELTKKALKKATEGVLPNIPGLDLFNGIL